MIHALRARLRRVDWRRVVGLVALFAFVFVVALSAAHAHGHDADQAAQDERCGVCSAALLIGTSESFTAPELIDVLDAASAVAPAVEHVPASRVLSRAHAPRGPPAAA